MTLVHPEVMSDDDAIREFRWRLLAGHYGDRELLMPADQDYSGMWSALIARVPEWEARFGFMHPLVFELRTEINRLADQRPNAVRVFALATTRYGEEHLYDRAA